MTGEGNLGVEEHSVGIGLMRNSIAAMRWNGGVHGGRGEVVGEKR